jgi:hypothetical protein
MTFLVTRVTLHIAQVLTFLLSRGVSIASVHNGTCIQIRARPLDMAHLATLMTSPLIATGCRGIAGFTRSIILTRDIYGAVFEPRNSVVIRRLTLGESVSNSPVPPNRGWGSLGDLMRLFPGTAFVNSPVIWRVPRISNVIWGIYLRKWPFLS